MKHKKMKGGDLMDLESILVTLILPIVTALISYWASRTKSKSELEKVQLESKQQIEILTQQNKHDLELLKEQTNSEINKVRELKDIELKANETGMTQDFAKQLLGEFMQNPSNAKNSISSLQDLAKELQQFNE